MSQEIHDKAAPFIKWLKEADEESSESEEESDDDVSCLSISYKTIQIRALFFIHV